MPLLAPPVPNPTAAQATAQRVKDDIKNSFAGIKQTYDTIAEII